MEIWSEWLATKLYCIPGYEAVLVKALSRAKRVEFKMWCVVKRGSY